MVLGKTASGQRASGITRCLTATYCFLLTVTY